MREHSLKYHHLLHSFCGMIPHKKCMVVLGISVAFVIYQGLPHLDLDITSPSIMSMFGHQRHQSIKTPSGSSILSAEFLDCMKDVGSNLPLKRDQTLAAHHWDARTGKWNEDIRFSTFLAALPENALILDIGGYTAAKDSESFREMFPAAVIHIYEPVPAFFEQLQAQWSAVRGVYLHQAGWGNSSRTVSLSSTELAGQSTFIMEATKQGPHRQSDDATSLKVVDGRAEIKKLLRGGEHKVIDLLHMNCEGCEWELLQHLCETNMLKSIRHLQVSFHNYGENGIGELLPKYCLIRETLVRTHEKIAAVPFGWERWSMKESVRENIET